MKIKLIIFLLLAASLNIAYAQRIPVVGVMAFETSGSGVTQADAQNVTSQVISELNSWGTLNVVQGSASAEYIIRGSISRQDGMFVLSSVTLNAASNQVLNEYSERARTVNEISFFAFCAKAVERISLPNYLLGTWQSTINMPDGPVVCIIEFKSDRTVTVERYDSWERRLNNVLRYEGYGTGTYSYAGFANRLVNLSGRQVRVDALASVNLTLEETLPDQASVNQSGLNIVFNNNRTSFEIISGMLPCGRNFDGPSIVLLGFSQFVKIR